MNHKQKTLNSFHQTRDYIKSNGRYKSNRSKSNRSKSKYLKPRASSRIKWNSPNRTQNGNIIWKSSSNGMSKSRKNARTNARKNARKNARTNARTKARATPRATHWARAKQYLSNAINPPPPPQKFLDLMERMKREASQAQIMENSITMNPDDIQAIFRSEY